jgi:putative spermidine/putrescine transport system substrate-binding protein
MSRWKLLPAKCFRSSSNVRTSQLPGFDGEDLIMDAKIYPLQRFIGPAISRRAMLKSTLATAVSAASLGAMPRLARAADGRLVFATWGGSWETAMRGAWFSPFAKETSVEVTTVQGPDYGKVRAMVTAGNTEWDVLECNPDFQWIGARENLLEKLDFSVIDRSAVAPDLITDYAVPQVLWSRVMVYNTKQFTHDNHPHTWQEVWDVKRFPGKRAFYSKANGGSLEFALLADGIPADKLYPLDVDRALRSLDRIRKDIIWYDTNQQITQFMTGGEFAVGVAPDGRALAAVDAKAAIAIEYNQSILTWSCMAVPKGAPDVKAAMRFLAFTLTPAAQAAIAMAFPYGPVVAKAFDLIPRERAEMLSGGPQQKGRSILSNERWWADNLEKVAEKFTAWRVG